RGPFPGDPSAPCESREKQPAAEKQTRLQSDTLQNTPQRYRTAVKALRIAEYFCECPDRENLRPKKGKDNAENHGVEVEPHVGRDLTRSEEHTSELQSLAYLVCRLLL